MGSRNQQPELNQGQVRDLSTVRNSTFRHPVARNPEEKASTAFSEAGNRILEFIFASDFRENIAARKHSTTAN